MSNMKKRYDVTIEEPGDEPDDDVYKDRTTKRLVVRHDGVRLCAHYDNGEPEDNTYVRDWAWVQGELQRAYDLGFKDGGEAR